MACAGVEVDAAADEGEEGLDCVYEDGVAEVFGC